MIYAQFLQNFVNTFSANLLRLKKQASQTFSPFWMNVNHCGRFEEDINRMEPKCSNREMNQRSTLHICWWCGIFLAFFNIFGSKFETQKFCVLIETAKIDKDGDGNDDEGEYKRKIHEMDSRSEKGILSEGSILRPLINISSMGLNASHSHELLTKRSMDIKATVNQYGHN